MPNTSPPQQAPATPVSIQSLISSCFSFFSFGSHEFEAYTAVVSTASSRPWLQRISRFGTRLLASLTNRQLRPLNRCLNDVALWRAAHKIERVACHKGEGRTRPRLQHRNIVGADEDNLIHDVCHDALWRYQFDGVSRTDILEHAKESIAVAGNSDVSVFTGVVRTHNVAHPAVEGQVIGTVK